MKLNDTLEQEAAENNKGRNLGIWKGMSSVTEGECRQGVAANVLAYLQILKAPHTEQN